MKTKSIPWVWALLMGLSCQVWGVDSPTTPKLEDLPLQSSITQYGITWTFATPARVGRFVNSDFYVVGPVTIQKINPRPLFGSLVQVANDPGEDPEPAYDGKLARNGSTLNLPAVVSPDPATGRTHRSGFDSRMPQHAYDPGQFHALPIGMKPGDSLVSSASAEPPIKGHPIKSVAVLTCMAEPQPADAFRPSFCQTSTSRIYLARNLRRDLLLHLPLPEGASRIKFSEYAESFQEPWIDTVANGRAMPRKKSAFWGAQIAELVGGSSLLLHLNVTSEEKEPLLIHMVQVGIDLFGLLRGGGEWHGEGGGNAGRKWPIIFAGIMLDDLNMADLMNSYPNARFHEDEQTVFCPVEYDGRSFERGWTGARVIWAGHYGYYQGRFSRIKKPMNHYGPVELFPPSEWPTPWPEGSEGYRRNATSSSWVAQALAARLMHAEAYWGHDAFFAYEDRWMTEDDTPFLEEMIQNVENKRATAKTDEEKKTLEAAKDKITQANRSGTVTGRPEMVALVKELWSQYRNNLPPAKDGTQMPPDSKTWK